MIVAIHQPNYLPWCGYFAKMSAADVFILLDNVDMSKGSYTSRCQIRNGDSPQWFSVPVRFHAGDPITAVQFANAQWAGKHLKTLKHIYGRCPFFDEVMAVVEPVYRDPGERLGEFNIRMIRRLADYLGLPCRLWKASELAAAGEGDDRLLALVRCVQGDTYLSGKGGQNYQDPKKFAAAGIELVVKTYAPISYPQGGHEFLGGLSIIDALCNLGRGAGTVLRYPAPADPPPVGTAI
jgi:hypothetical protein